VAPVTGYIKLWRQMAEHGHLNMPDNALKVFIYLMFRAGREARPKLGLDEGEAWVSYEDIQESCSERVDLDGREVDRTMSRSTVAKILRFLEAPEQGYIKRVKSGLGSGMKIKVLNYQKLQKIACTSDSSQIELGSELGIELAIEHKQEVTKNHKEKIPPLPPKGRRVKSRSSDEYTPEFETFWSNYPKDRRIDKLAAFAKWKARLKQGVNPEDLIFAARAYGYQIVADQTAAKYIMHPETFLGDKERWVKYTTTDMRQYVAMMDRLGKEGAK
jgi:hypothetical protein